MKDIFETFESITGYSIINYLSDIGNFFQKESSNILGFYSGDIQNMNIGSFNKLAYFINESYKINEIFLNNSNSFSGAEYWELLDKVEDIKTKLQTLDNASKWMRSSITKNAFYANPEIDYILGQNQTLEDVNNNLGNNNSDGWVDIANRNNLKEEDYTSEGGNLLKVNYGANLKFSIESIVDNPQGEKIYGLDIDKAMIFENGDLKVLTYKETLNQSVLTLLELRRGDNPEYPSEGIQANLVIGNTLSGVLYPSIFKQLFQTFKSDDSIKSFSLKDIVKNKTALFFNFEIETRLGDIQKEILPI